ncbi:hypothetical protein HanRHA438_Chr14g0678431 [Helianthus annuus]|nr:hypothetical protein HanIR_Chr14g0724011 [Helianthus annuus]KAJ0855899.1 hypothetical protein HanRHA438_Chr14g0678431 [Helianthus annuus]
MASAIVRSTLRTTLRGGPRVNPASTRSFSACASAEEEARMLPFPFRASVGIIAKSRKFTYVWRPIWGFLLRISLNN